MVQLKPSRFPFKFHSESCAEFIDTPDNEFMITTSDIYATPALVFPAPIRSQASHLTAKRYDLRVPDGYTVPEALEQAAKDFTDRNVSDKGK